MAGLKTRAYTTSTFGFVRRPEAPAPIAALQHCAELIVPSSAVSAVEILLKRTLSGVSLMGRTRDSRGVAFILRLAGGWKAHDILGHVGRHLDHNVRIKVRAIPAAAAEQILARQRTRAFLKLARRERNQRTRRR